MGWSIRTFYRILFFIEFYIDWSVLLYIIFLLLIKK